MTALTVALVGITSARSIFWPIPTRFLSGVGAAAGLAFINSIGTAGGFAGPYLMGWLRDFTGSFEAGLLVMSGVLLGQLLRAWPFLVDVAVNDDDAILHAVPLGQRNYPVEHSLRVLAR